MNAIVRCSAYRAGQPPQIISIEAISDAVAEPGTFVWLGLYEPSASLMHQIQEEFNLHELVVEDALKAHQRPKIDAHGPVGPGWYYPTSSPQKRNHGPLMPVGVSRTMPTAKRPGITKG